MLLTRIITTLFLIPAVVAGIIYLPPLYFNGLSAVLFLGCGFEWSKLCALSCIHQAGFLLLQALMMAGLYWFNTPLWAFGTGCLIWCVLFLFIFANEKKWAFLNKRFIKMVIGLIILPTAWFALITLRARDFGAHWLIGLCLLVWSTDIFAYFAGRFFGKTKLAPKISPGKTLAGYWGGLIGALGVGLLLYYLFRPMPLFLWALILFITINVAVLGDLFESLIKRLAKVKDSGSLLPGHGGLLDRLDSLIATLPFYTGLIFWVKG